MVQDGELKKTVRQAKKLHRIFVGAILVCVVVLVVLRVTGVYTPPFVSTDPTLNLMALVLGMVAVVNLFLGLFYFRRSLAQAKQKAAAAGQSALGAFVPAFIVHLAFIEAIALYGLVLGILGAPGFMCLLFFVASAMRLIQIAPTAAQVKALAG